MKDENDCAIFYHFTVNTAFSFVSTQNQYFSAYIQLYLVRKELQPWILAAISGVCHIDCDLQ
jgi:hypothetical protein